MGATHSVGKLKLRVSVNDGEVAEVVRARLEDLARGQLPLAIERVADALGLGDTWLRVERLELVVAPIWAAADLTASFEAALEQALRNAWHAARTGASDEGVIASGSEHRAARFALYLETGFLPPAERRSPLELLRDLAAGDPAMLVAIFRRTGRRAHMLERFVLQFGGEGIAALVALFAPADAATIQALLADVLRVHRVAPMPIARPALEQVLRIATIEFMIHDAGTQFNRRRYLDHILRREAMRAGISYAALLGLLDAALRARRMGLRSSLPVVLGELLGEQRLLPRLSLAPRTVDAWETARAGDFAPLARLTRHVRGHRLLGIADRLDRDLFVGLVAELEPGEAPTIAALVDAVVLGPQAAAEPAQPGAARALRRLTLRFLRHDAGSGFNRRRYLDFLIRNEATRGGLSETALRAALAEAVGRVHAVQGREGTLATALAELLAEHALPAPSPIVRLGAALASWLDTGVLPRGRPAASTLLLSSLDRLSDTELRRLFVRKDGVGASARLRRAMRALGAAGGDRLLARLAPRIPAGAGRVKAVVAALEGRPMSVAGDDMAALLAWLNGGRVSSGDAAALTRRLAACVARGDKRLVAYFVRHSGDVAAAARWARTLPFDAVLRITPMLSPGCERLVETARLFGAVGGNRERMARVLLSLGAQRASPKGVAALLAASGGNAGAIRRKAIDRADGALATLLRQDAAVSFIEPVDALYIDDAGLVLLAPYLPALFERLGMLQPGAVLIEGQEARSRAVHLVRYLATGELDAPEPRLLLPKLLCGLPTAEPVLAKAEPDAEMLATCDGLLAAVVANWPMLGIASVAALRETFLQREGRLLQAEGTWSLVVQRRGLIDHLVDHVPWSLSTVFHRWMPAPIQVTW